MASSLMGKVVQGAVVGGLGALGTAVLGPVGGIAGIVLGRALTASDSADSTSLADGTHDVSQGTESVASVHSDFFDSIFNS
jgi:hypothetical protein